MLIDKLKSPYFLLSLCAIVISIVGLSLGQWFIASNPVLISKVPNDTKLFINNKEVGGARTNLANGVYAIRAEKSGFSTYTGSVIIDDSSKYISVALLPESEEAEKWSRENSAAYTNQEKESGQYLIKSAQAAAEKNPIISSLPIDNYTSKIGYIRDEDDASGNSIILTISAEDGYRNTAIESLYYAGFDPGDYTYKFYDYSNPFEETQNAQ